MIELKPCPFCGGNAKFARIAGEGTEAVCLECHCGTPKYFSVSENPDTEKEMAAQVWNKRTSGWISVNDRLPEEDVRVLIVGKRGGVQIARSIECGSCSNGRLWISDTRKYPKPTHWMKLPEPPEVNE